IENPVIRKRVNKITKKSFLFKIKKSLDFCKLNTLNNKVDKKWIFVKAISNIFQHIQNVFKFFFKWLCLGFYKVFSYNLSHTFSFLNRIKTKA
ncbi:hypothetical protein K469DRAFT_580642, partial [Zopfia rhizophila CBS 207.26]